MAAAAATTHTTRLALLRHLRRRDDSHALCSPLAPSAGLINHRFKPPRPSLFVFNQHSTSCFHYDTRPSRLPSLAFASALSTSLHYISHLPTFVLPLPSPFLCFQSRCFQVPESSSSTKRCNVRVTYSNLGAAEISHMKPTETVPSNRL